MSHEVDCKAFEARINNLLDERVPLEEDKILQLHARTCAPCNAILDDYLALNDSLSNVVLDIPALSQKTLNTQPRFTGSWLAIAIAAIVVIGFGIGLRDSVEDFATPQDDSIAVTENQNSIDLVNQLVVDDAATTNFDETPSSKTTPVQDEHFLFEPFVISPELSPEAFWTSISQQLDPLGPYYKYPAELPGIRPIQSSINLTMNWVHDALAGL